MSNPDVEPRRCGRLAEKKARSATSEPLPPIPPPKPRKPVLSPAERVKAYRQRLKEYPERYQRYLAENKEKCKLYRQTLSEEKKAEQRVKASVMRQIARQRNKECQTQKMKTRKDFSAVNSQREKWREQKRRQAEQMHWRTREKKNEQRRLLYQEKKRAARENNSKSVQCEGSSCSIGHGPPAVPTGFEGRSPQAQRKALQRARSALPKSPRKFVATIATLIQKASPKKKQLFATKMTQLVPTQQMGHLFMIACQRLRNKQLSADRHTRGVLLSVCKGIGSFSERSAMLGVHWTTVKRHESKKEKTKRENPAELHAREFYEESASAIPDKKLVSRKTGKAAAILQRPIKELYQEFCTNAGQQISFSKFAKCRPANIRLMAQAKLRQCLCEYCTNAKLKLETLNSVAAVRNRNCWIRHERHAVALITCSPKNKACCYGECAQCGLHKFDSHVGPLLGHTGELTWHCWESKTVLSRGKRVNRKFLATKKGDIQQLVSDLHRELKFLSQHIFRADWQLQQFAEMRRTTPFPSDSICMVMDFAENFACTYQEEIQAAHWHHEQVTVHPTVTYYRCPACSEATTESLVFISADKKHDHHAVHNFTTKALTHLRETRGLTISHIVQWTDGCASQYKSKGPFADIASSLSDFDATLERNFFGSRHGKSPSDGESAVVKHHASSAVVSKKAIIANAWDMFQHLQNSILNKQPPADGCSHFLRSFFWVGEEEIKRHRPQRNVKTVPGTRSFHSVRCIEQNTIHSRHLTCMCRSCQTGVGFCLEEQVVGSWVSHELEMQPQRHPTQQQTRCRVRQSHPAYPTAQCSNAAMLESDPVLPSQLDDDFDKVVDPVCALGPQGVEDDPSLQPHSPPVLDHQPLVHNEGPAIPSVVTLPTIDTTTMSAGDVLNVQVLFPSEAVDIVPSSSPEASPAVSPVLSRLSKQQIMAMEDKHSTPTTETSTSHHQPDPSATDEIQLVNISHLKVNQYVEAEVPSRDGKKTERFIGKIRAIHEEDKDIYLDFLKLHPSFLYFTWPDTRDDAWVSLHQIRRVMVNPFIDSRGHYTFNG